MIDNFDNISNNIRGMFADSPHQMRLRAEKCIANIAELRQTHKCLLVLPKKTARDLQYKAILADIKDGSRYLHKVRTRDGKEIIFFKHI